MSEALGKLERKLKIYQRICCDYDRHLTLAQHTIDVLCDKLASEISAMENYKPGEDSASYWRDWAEKKARERMGE